MRRKRAPITIDAMPSRSGLGALGNLNPLYDKYFPGWREADPVGLMHAPGPRPYPTATWDAYNATWLGKAPIKGVATRAAQAKNVGDWKFAVNAALSRTEYADPYNMTGARTVGGYPEYKYGYLGRERIIGPLNELAKAAEVSVGSWEPYIDVYWMQEWADQIAHGRTPEHIFSHRQGYGDTLLGVIANAARDLNAPQLMEVANASIGPATAWYQSYNELPNAVESARDKARFNKMLTMAAIIGTMGIASLYAAPAAAAEVGASAAAGTASVSGAELAALVEAGTVGAEGAFLEAAALTGSTVTYNTATGAIVGAVLPTGTSVAFDASLDAFAQFGVDPSAVTIAEAAPTNVAAAEEAALMEEVAAAQEGLAAESSLQNTALAEIAGDVPAGTLAEMVGQESAAEMLAEGAAVLGPESAAAATWYSEAGQAIVNKLTQMGKNRLASELQQAFLGSGEPASAGTSTSEGGYNLLPPYGEDGEFDLEGEENLQPGFIRGTLGKAAVPVTIGAGLGLLALFMLGNDERN